MLVIVLLYATFRNCKNVFRFTLLFYICTFTRVDICGVSSHYLRQSSLRVVSGTKDVNNEYSFVLPLVIRLYEDKYFRLCTTSLIAPNWVITASHCVMDAIKKNEVGKLYVADKNITYDLSGKKVLRAVMHPNYLAGDDKNDIAVALVEKVVNITPTSLCSVDYRTLKGRAVRYVGAGSTYNNYIKSFKPALKNKISEADEHGPLQVGEGIIGICKYLGLFNPVICIAPKCSNVAGTVQEGDSGGPVLYNNKVAGVCFGLILDNDITNTIYIPVSPYLDWIHYVITANTVRSRTLKL